VAFLCIVRKSFSEKWKWTWNARWFRLLK